MTISFDTIPSNVLTPGVFTEIDASNAQQGLVVQPYKVLIIGYREEASPVAELTLKQVTHPNQAREHFGAASMAHQMAQAHFANNLVTETWMIGLTPPAAGTEATGTVTFTAATPSAGTIHFHIGGRRVQVGVTAASTATTLAEALVAAIAADDTMPVTAANTLGVVTLTAVHKGEHGNQIDVRRGYFGDELPAGVGVAIVGMASGAGVYDLDDVWAVTGDVQFNVIACPFTDTAALISLETELDRKWGAMIHSAGYGFMAFDGDHSTTSALGDGRNNGHTSIFSSFGVPMPVWEVAAGLAAIAALGYSNDPGKALQGRPLVGFLPPLEADRWTREERQLLLESGIATVEVDAAGRLVIERTASTWTKNAVGSPDIAFRDANTHFTVDYLQFTARARISSRFQDFKLADDGTEFSSSQDVMTPQLLKSELVALYQDSIELGLVQDLGGYKNSIVAEIDSGDPSRINVQHAPRLIGQARIFALKLQFQL